MKQRIFLIIIAMLGLAALSCSLFNAFSKSDGLSFSPDTLPDGQVDQTYSAVVSLSNQRTPAFEMSVSDDSLPPGLIGTFDKDKQTYTLAGKPTQAGTFTLTLSALCYGTNVSGQSGEKVYKLVVK
jgi:hypothetical protein